MRDQEQLDLFSHVAAAYAGAGRPLRNDELYQALEKSACLSPATLAERRPIGSSRAMHSPGKRAVRWYQQTLKRLNIIERVEGQRGVWQLATKLTKDLDRACDDVKVLAFSTDYGVAIWAKHDTVIPSLGEEISLMISSPPYPLQVARAYGNPSAAEFVDYICRALEPVVANLKPGGSIVLNLSNDIFLPKSPARSTYLERTVIALEDRLGLFMMERIPWVNLSKPPSPTIWACVKKIHRTAAWEPVYWFTNDPAKVSSDVTRILEAHTDRQMKLMAAGGVTYRKSYGDGAYRTRPGSYGNQTAGKLPRNVIMRGHACADTTAYRKAAKQLGLPVHGAMQPTHIAETLIEQLTEPGELVVDIFGGTTRVGLAAERLGRRWLVVEWVLQYLRGAAELYRGFDGFALNPAIGGAFNRPD